MLNHDERVCGTDESKRLNSSKLNDIESSDEKGKIHAPLLYDSLDKQFSKHNSPHGSQLNPNLKTVRRSNKAVQALNLPTVININPRSLNNKLESFKTYMIEEEIDVAFISESHEREGNPLVDSLQMNSFEIISSLHQRRGKGGRPALVVKKEKN